MRKNQQVLKLFIVLFFCSAYVFGFSHYGAKAFSSLFAGEEGFLPGTAIATVNVEGKSPTEALALVKTAIEGWQNNTTYKLSYKEKTIELEVSQFAFDPEGTISSLVNGRQNGIHVTLDETVLLEWIGLISPQLIGQEINLADLNAKLVEPASTLTSGEVIIKLSDFLAAGDKEPKVIASGAVTVKEDIFELETAIEAFKDITVEPGKEFSFAGFIEEKKVEGLTPTALSIMASAAYTAVLQTNFDIVERNISKELPLFAKLGSEARIDPELGLDFAFSNPNEESFSLEFKYSKGKVTASIIGTPFLYEYKIVSDGAEVFKPKTIIQFSPLLKTGQVNIKEKGKEGKIIKMYREIYSGATLIDTVAISEDFYAPVHRIEVKALTVQEPATGETPAQNTDGTDTSGSEQPADGTVDPTVTTPSLPPSGNTATEGEDETDEESGADDGSLWGKPNEQPK